MWRAQVSGILALYRHWEGRRWVLKIIVCEDTRKDRDALCSLIRKFFDGINCPVSIAAYETGEALLHDSEMLASGGAKIAFMDIYLPGMSGIDVAKKIRETDRDMIIVFTTSSLDHGLDGYAVRALQYLVKPVDYAGVEGVLGECERLFADSLRHIEIVSDRLTVRVLLKDIFFIESFRNLCHLHTPSGTLKCYRSLDEIEQQLDGGTFLRTHRSFVVNMRHVNDVMENDFLLANGERVPIRRNNKLAVKQAYMDYSFALTREG